MKTQNVTCPLSTQCNTGDNAVFTMDAHGKDASGER